MSAITVPPNSCVRSFEPVPAKVLGDLQQMQTLYITKTVYYQVFLVSHGYHGLLKKVSKTWRNLLHSSDYANYEARKQWCRNCCLFLLRINGGVRILKTMSFVIFIEVKIAENYKDEGYDVDRQGNTFEPQRKWDGDGYEEGCDPKEEAKLMENRGNCYSGGTVAEVNKLAYQDTSEGK